MLLLPHMFSCQSSLKLITAQMSSAHLLSLSFIFLCLSLSPSLPSSLCLFLSFFHPLFPSLSFSLFVLLHSLCLSLLSFCLFLSFISLPLSPLSPLLFLSVSVFLLHTHTHTYPCMHSQTHTQWWQTKLPSSPANNCFLTALDYIKALKYQTNYVLFYFDSAVIYLKL